jgi:hypothetical protein
MRSVVNTLAFNTLIQLWWVLLLTAISEPCILPTENEIKKLFFWIFLVKLISWLSGNYFLSS